MHKSNTARLAFFFLISLLIIACGAVEQIPGLHVATVTLPVLVTRAPQFATAKPGWQVGPTAGVLATLPTTATEISTTKIPALPTTTPIPLESLSYSSCDQLNVVQDVTIPDGTEVNPGEIFIKSWRIENTGKCAWDDHYRMVFYQGDMMDVPGEIPPFFIKMKDTIGPEIGSWGVRIHKIEPGAKVDLAVAFRAPQTPGDVSSYWMLLNDKGEKVNPMFWVMVKVKEAPAEGEQTWAGEWMIRDPYRTEPRLTRTILQQKGREVSGFFYNVRGNLTLISGWMEEGGNTVKGEYGEPWQDFSTPFEWKLGKDMKRFQSILREGNVRPGVWCGTRPGGDLPEPCGVEIDN